jgi:hypothetical protein
LHAPEHLHGVDGVFQMMRDYTGTLASPSCCSMGCGG